MRETRGPDDLDLHNIQNQMDMQLREKDEKIPSLLQEIDFYKK